MSFHSTDTVDERIALIINCRVKHIISFFFLKSEIFIIIIIVRLSSRITAQHSVCLECTVKLESESQF